MIACWVLAMPFGHYLEIDVSMVAAKENGRPCVLPRVSTAVYGNGWPDTTVEAMWDGEQWCASVEEAMAKAEKLASEIEKKYLYPGVFLRGEEARQQRSAYWRVS